MIAWWFALPEPVRKALMWIGAILGVILLGKAYVASERGKARKDERQKSEAKTIEVVHQIEKDSINDADTALEARDNAAVYGSPDSVPDATADRIFRD